MSNPKPLSNHECKWQRARIKKNEKPKRTGGVWKSTLAVGFVENKVGFPKPRKVFDDRCSMCEGSSVVRNIKGVYEPCARCRP